MAYMQKPGRGNNPKTGYGVPAPFKQTDIELTKKYDQGKELLKKQREKGSTPSGMKVDSKTGAAKASGYEKTFEEPSAENAFTARIKDSKGKQIAMAKADNVSGNMVPGGGKAVEKLREQYNKEKAFTEGTRAKNVDQYNATSGGTSPDKLSEGQKKTLVNLAKAKKS
jgi:hypothetical protein